MKQENKLIIGVAYEQKVHYFLYKKIMIHNVPLDYHEKEIDKKNDETEKNSSLEQSMHSLQKGSPSFFIQKNNDIQYICELSVDYCEKKVKRNIETRKKKPINGVVHRRIVYYCSYKKIMIHVIKLKIYIYVYDAPHIYRRRVVIHNNSGETGRAN